MFCATESSTAIHLGETDKSLRAIDRYNPIINPSRRSLSSSSSNHQILKPAVNVVTEMRKSSASLVDVVRKSSCIKPTAYFSPPVSKPLLIQSSTFESDEKGKDGKNIGENLVKCSSLKLKNDVHSADKYYYSPFYVNSHQVVVVRVSLHCKGCAGKVKKYISRMQGITSFNVDFEAKKVIAVGYVTPLEVLANISKVRTAQLLPPEKPNATLVLRANVDAKQVIEESIKTLSIG